MTTQGSSFRVDEALRQALFSLWRFGSHALVAWTPAPGGIDVLTVPKMRLFTGPVPHRRVFAGGRLMGRQTFDLVAGGFGAQPVTIRLGRGVGPGPDDISPDVVEALFEMFAVTRTERRAAALLDIVGFSRLAPELQAAQLSALEFALNIAAETARAHGVDAPIARSTTGDGFYVWNARKGVAADEDLFIVLVIFLMIHAGLRQRSAHAEAVPGLRAAVTIGSHYSFHQPDRVAGDRHRFIVGQATIELARLMNAAKAGQILIGEFSRRDDSSDVVYDTEAFLERVAARLKGLPAFAVLGYDIERVAMYLTGPRGADGAYTVEKLNVVDKHGLAHAAYNAKVNVFPRHGDPWLCGLRYEDLRAATPAQ